MYIFKEATPHSAGPGVAIITTVSKEELRTWEGGFLVQLWSVLRGFKVQVGGLGGPFEFHFRSSGGLGGQEATGKGFGRPWVGPGAAGAGDPEMDPNMSPT